jgi:hypothetical protein
LGFAVVARRWGFSWRMVPLPQSHRTHRDDGKRRRVRAFLGPHYFRKYRTNPFLQGGFGGLDKVAHLDRVFDAGFVGDFDAGGDIDGVGFGDANGVGDVVRGEAAGEDDWGEIVEFAGGAGFGDPVPVEGLAGAAEFFRGGVEEDCGRDKGERGEYGRQRGEGVS